MESTIKLKNRILIDGKAGSGKTWLCRELVDNFLKEHHVSLLTYTDYHKQDVIDFCERYRNKADLVIALGSDKKEIILDILLSQQKRRLNILDKKGVIQESLQVAIFDECEYFDSGQRAKLIYDKP